MEFGREFFTKICLVSLSSVKIVPVSHISFKGRYCVPIYSLFLAHLSKFRLGAGLSKFRLGAGFSKFRLGAELSKFSVGRRFKQISVGCRFEQISVGCRLEQIFGWVPT